MTNNFIRTLHEPYICNVLYLTVQYRKITCFNPLWSTNIYINDMLRAGVTYMQGSMYKVTPKILVILALGGTVCYI